MAVGESQALGGEPVEVRRDGGRVAVAAELAVAEVVGQKEHDVGPGWGCRGRRRRRWLAAERGGPGRLLPRRRLLLLADGIERGRVFNAARWPAGRALRIREFGRHAHGQPAEPLDHRRVRRRHVGRLPEIGFEIVEPGLLERGRQLLPLAAYALRLAGDGELPAALPDRLQFVTRKIGVGLAGRLGGRAKQKPRDVAAVDHGLRRHRAAGQRHERGQQVDRARDRIAGGAGGNPAGPAGDRGHADAPFPGAPLAAPQRACRGEVLDRADPGPVVAREDHERLLVDTVIPQGIKHLPHAPVHLFDPVAERAVAGAAAELLPRQQRQVNRGVGQVEEERPVLRIADEGHGLVGVAGHDLPLGVVGKQFGDLVVPHERHHPLARLRRDPLHVVGVGDPEVAVEALAGGQKLGLVAQVPLADAGGGVAKGLEPLGDRHLGRVEPLGAGGEVDARRADPRAVAAGEQLRPRHRADRGRVETRELPSLGRHPLEVRRLLPRGAKGADVAVAEVVNEDHDDVGRLGREAVG